MIPLSLVVLHTGDSVTVAEYLFRVLVYLFALAGITITIYWVVHAVGLVQSTIDTRQNMDHQ